MSYRIRFDQFLSSKSVYHSHVSFDGDPQGWKKTLVVATSL